MPSHLGLSAAGLTPTTLTSRFAVGLLVLGTRLVAGGGRGRGRRVSLCPGNNVTLGDAEVGEGGGSSCPGNNVTLGEAGGGGGGSFLSWKQHDFGEGGSSCPGNYVTLGEGGLLALETT